MERKNLSSAQDLCKQEWNQIVTKQINNALGVKLDGPFISANYPAGFLCNVKERYYNAGTLKVLDTLVKVEDDITTMDGVYSTLYKRVIDNLEYGISSEDKALINQEQVAQSALVGQIIDLYHDSSLDDIPQDYPSVMYIMKRIKEVTGSSYLDVDMKEYPDLAALCSSLSEYARLAVFTSKMQNMWVEAKDRLDAIKKNIENPTEENGGLRTGAKEDEIYIGWEHLPETIQLLNELKQGNNVSFTINVDEFGEKESNLHFDSKVDFKIPFNWFFNIKVNHEHGYDLSEYAQNSSSMSINIEFKGITTFAAVPCNLTENKKGWFASDILMDASAKSGQDATGYQLHGSEFNPAELFGEDGKLRRMKTLVISQQPIISLHFERFNCEEMQKIFTQSTDVDFKLFGGIISGEHKNDYKFTECKYNSEMQTLDVTIMPTMIGDVGSAGKQAAFVLGGVSEYF